MNRRTYIKTGAIATVLPLSGCLDFITGKEPLSFTASPAYAADEVATENGFEYEKTDTISLEETVSYNGQERTVRLSNWQVEYRKSVQTILGEFEASRFITFTTPQFDLFGTSMNPVDGMTNKELIDFVAEHYGAINSVENTGEITTESLGEETTVAKYETTITVQDQTVDAYLHMAKVTHEGDHIIAIGVYPQQVNEEESVIALIEGLEHDPDASNPAPDEEEGNETSEQPRA